MAPFTDTKLRERRLLSWNVSGERFANSASLDSVWHHEDKLLVFPAHTQWGPSRVTGTPAIYRNQEEIILMPSRLQTWKNAGHKRLFWYYDTWYMLLSSRFKIDVITTTGAACKQFWFVKILKTNFVTLKSGIWNLQFISAKLRNRCILLELSVCTTFLHLRYLLLRLLESSLLRQTPSALLNCT